MKRSYKTFICLSLIAIIVMIPGCGNKNEIGEGDTINFALAGPLETLESLGFQKGMELAVSEINEKGILDGKTIQVDQFDDKEDLTEGIKIAQKVSSAKKYSALIGHFSSNIALATKNTYNDNKVLVLSPMISNIEFTDPKMDFLFRNVASDQSEVEKILEYAASKGIKNIAVCYRNNDYGGQLSTVINKKAKDYGITVMDSHSDFINDIEFSKQYNKWKAMDVEAIFIGDSMPEAESFIKLIRSKDQSIPILGVGGFAFADIIESLPSISNGITYVDPYYYDSSTSTVKKFEKAYKNKYKEDPGSLSISGYDTVYLLANAIEKSGSGNPEMLAETLEKSGPWPGLINEISFDESGNALGINLHLVQIVNGSYNIL